MGPVNRRYCACGATRDAPASLRVVACVRCGRSLTSSPGLPPPPPSTSLAIVAALVTQLLGALAFCAVVAWAWTVGAEVRIAASVLLAVAALWVFAGGAALRGSVAALGCCAGLDIALALLVLANASSAHGFVHPIVAHFAPTLVAHLDRAREHRQRRGAGGARVRRGVPAGPPDGGVAGRAGGAGRLATFLDSRAETHRARRCCHRSGSAARRLIARGYWITLTHDAMSKNMKASAFSCGDSGPVEHASGNEPDGVWSPPTCMSENTTLPQRWSAAASFGVVNWKFCGICAPLSQYTHCSALL
jgi:hypothetical protein